MLWIVVASAISLGGRGGAVAVRAVAMGAGGEDLGELNHHERRRDLVSVREILLCVGCVGVLGGKVVGLEGGHRGFVGFVLVVAILRGMWEWRLVGQ